MVKKVKWICQACSNIDGLKVGTGIIVFGCAGISWRGDSRNVSGFLLFECHDSIHLLHWTFDQPKTNIWRYTVPACGSVGFCVEECGFNSWLCAKVMTCCNGSDFFSSVDALADLGLISKFHEVLCGKLYSFATFWNGSFGISTNLSISPPGGGSIYRVRSIRQFPSTGALKRHERLQ